MYVYLVDVYRNCLRVECNIPDGWKIVFVVFIPKAGKPSHIGPKDYSPISLSSFLLKALERLI